MEKSTLNKIFYHVFTCLETFETTKAVYWRVHMERENVICKKCFKSSNIVKRAFEFTKQIIAIKVLLVIELDVDL